MNLLCLYRLTLLLAWHHLNIFPLFGFEFYNVKTRCFPTFHSNYSSFMVDVFPDVPSLCIDLIYCLVIQHCWASVAILKFYYCLLVLEMLYAGVVM
jgi:hypothetical protein